MVKVICNSCLLSKHYKGVRIFCKIKDFSPQTCLPAGRDAKNAEGKRQINSVTDIHRLKLRLNAKEEKELILRN